MEARVKHGEQPLRQSSSREGGAAPATAAAPLLHTSAWHHTLTEPPSQPFQPCMVHLTSQLLPRSTPFGLALARSVLASRELFTQKMIRGTTRMRVRLVVSSASSNCGETAGGWVGADGCWWVGGWADEARH